MDSDVVRPFLSSCVDSRIGSWGGLCSTCGGTGLALQCLAPQYSGLLISPESRGGHGEVETGPGRVEEQHRQRRRGDTSRRTEVSRYSLRSSSYKVRQGKMMGGVDVAPQRSAHRIGNTGFPSPSNRFLPDKLQPFFPTDVSSKHLFDLCVL